MTAVAALDSGDLLMFELFLSDARGNAAVLKQSLGLAVGGADAALLLPLLTMAAHSIKGAARIVQFEPAALVADELETTFRRVEDGDLTLTRGLAAALLIGAEMLLDIGELKPAELLAWAEREHERVRAVVHTVRSGVVRGATQNPSALTPRTPEAPSVRVAASVAPTVEPEIFALFRVEAEACSATLSRGLVELESGGVADLEALMRAAHSIKGAARIVGIDVATRVAHAMEECFVAAQAGTLRLAGGHVDQLLQAVDLLADISHCAPHQVRDWETEEGPGADELAERLNKIASGELVRSSLKAPTQAIERTSEARATIALIAPAPATAMAEGTAPPLAPPDREPTGVAADRVVRVAAQSINRLMGLAGESLVESRRVQSLGNSMQRLKRRQAALSDVLDTLEARNATVLDAETKAIVLDAKTRALECRALLTEQIAELDSYARRMDDLSERLYREALKSRMRPFGDCVHGFPRMVRDLGRQLGKTVRLQVVGESTDVDRDVLESLEAPLNHLLRNGVDHGLEPPDERRAHGKPEQGTIRLEARHHAGVLAITVSDDGRGIESERIRAKIVERGLLAPNVARDLTVPELMEFIFLPGFSTARGVTEISGRGVGLDAVRSAVEAASGVVRVVSEQGRGTTFHLQLPVTRSVMRAVVSEVSGQAYAFPLLRIERVIRIPASEVNTLGNMPYFVLGDSNIALVSAQQILGLVAPGVSANELCVVIVGDRTHRYGVTVDKFLGEHDLVVRPLDPRLGKVQDIAAAAILMNGSPALIFDVDDLVRSIEKLAHSGRVEKLTAGKGTTVEKPRKRVLVVDDSATVRAAERQLLVNQGYDVDVAVDGVDGWNCVRNATYDLVISDIDMPRMNGIELVRMIRQDVKLNGIPIVIVSYKDREEDRLRGLDAGANYYLTKSSFHDATLVQAVEDLLGSSSP